MNKPLVDPSALLDTGWHWPQFGATLCGTSTDRERLGLLDYYVPARFDDLQRSIMRELHGAPMQRLLSILGDPATSLGHRLEAGRQLALLGDPRLDPLSPEMVEIPAAAVRIGLDASAVADVVHRYAALGLDEQWIAKECPRHEVALAPYRIARFPVTNGEYRAFLLDSNYEEIPDSWTFRRFPGERANHPVYSVSPAACDAYARWLSSRTGRAFRLPTEAEWEFAAAGPLNLEFPWGDVFDADLANTCETGLFTTSPVGAFVGGESPFGVVDMAGNVEEYVADDYRPYPGGTGIDDHLSQIHGRYRVALGGSFARFRDLARTRRRHGHNPRSTVYAMGFRLCESPFSDGHAPT
jgi:formylglycine-generating enzyme required for sulfatase activity